MKPEQTGIKWVNWNLLDWLVGLGQGSHQPLIVNKCRYKSLNFTKIALTALTPGWRTSLPRVPVAPYPPNCRPLACLPPLVVDLKGGRVGKVGIPQNEAEAWQEGVTWLCRVDLMVMLSAWSQAMTPVLQQGELPQTKQTTHWGGIGGNPIY